jgi:hypothetical protein
LGMACGPVRRAGANAGQKLRILAYLTGCKSEKCSRGICGFWQIHPFTLRPRGGIGPWPSGSPPRVPHPWVGPVSQVPFLDQLHRAHLSPNRSAAQLHRDWQGITHDRESQLEFRRRNDEGTGPCLLPRGSRAAPKGPMASCPLVHVGVGEMAAFTQHPRRHATISDSRSGLSGTPRPRMARNRC